VRLKPNGHVAERFRPTVRVDARDEGTGAYTRSRAVRPFDDGDAVEYEIAVPPWSRRYHQICPSRKNRFVTARVKSRPSGWPWRRLGRIGGVHAKFVTHRCYKTVAIAWH